MTGGKGDSWIEAGFSELARSGVEGVRVEVLAKDLGVQKNVVFFNRFVELEELMRFIGAADIYLTPYLTEAQITSGTLAYAFGAGNAVVSTPYWHAAELLAAERGKTGTVSRRQGHCSCRGGTAAG